MVLQSHAFSRFFDLIVQEFIGSERFSGILDEAMASPLDRGDTSPNGSDKTDPGC